MSAKASGRPLVISSVPGRMPWIVSAPRSTAGPAPLGMPNVNVVSSDAPSFASLAASGAMTPRMSPSPNPLSGPARLAASLYATNAAAVPPSPG
jgi:hypothetical protein